MQLLRHYREKLYLFFLMLITKKCFELIFHVCDSICEKKHTSRDNAISRTKSRCIYLKMGIFRYTIYDVHMLFDENPFAQSIPLTMLLPGITSIHDQVK
jgi:hypothetical protein